jgi:hypothetical protein
MTERLILKRASASRSSGTWKDGDFDVLLGRWGLTGKFNRSRTWSKVRQFRRIYSPLTPAAHRA